MNDFQLQATNIHKRFGEREVLKGISFAAKAGDVVLLAGKGHETYQVRQRPATSSR